MASKYERLMGFFRGLNFTARLNEVAFLAMVQKEIESGEYKKEYDTVREFVKEVVGITYEGYRARTEALRALGPEITGVLVDMKLHIRDVKMIEHMMTEEQKSSLKKGVLDLGDRKIPLNEEHYEDVKIAFANLKEQAELARKAEKQAKKEHDSLKKEYDKDSAPIKKELERLKAIMNPETPEKLEEAFLALDKMLDDFDTALRALVWKTPWVKDNPEAHAKVEAIQTRVEKRFEGFRVDWDEFCN